MPIELKSILECLLFSAPKPLSVSEIRDALNRAATEEEATPEAKSFHKVPIETLEEALATLAQEHETAARSYRLVCVAGSWQFVTQPEFGPWLRAFVGVKNRPARLSQPALETLAVIAYRQPVTRAEIEQIRGVAVDGVMATLKERGLIEEVGRAEVIGRPMQFGTTMAFLEYFGLGRLEDLPAADELRRIPVVRPESLATADAAAGSAVSELPLEQADPEVAGGRGVTPEAPVVPESNARLEEPPAA
ncbi:MAG: SMC-Scp complex subunit ScpB [Verrucomicrobiota bacterium]|jgi:segregation and condensation protein B